jgi:hypothetical protein
VLVLVEGGAGVPIGEHTEGVQLHYRLGCGVHFRLCTPRAVRGARDLVCRFCTPDEALRAAGEGARPTALERGIFAAMCAAGLGPGLRPEVRVPWWAGRVDFAHAPSGVLIQIDGPHHFRGKAFGLLSSRYAQLDADMCAAAWAAGRVLVRVHHCDTAGGCGANLVAAAVARAQQGVEGPLLILSSHFWPPEARTPAPAQRHSVLPFRLQAVLGPLALTRDPGGNLWLAPNPM